MARLLRKLNLKAKLRWRRAHVAARRGLCGPPGLARAALPVSARCSRHNYYAPCIDRPEVLALYRRAVARLCQLVPIEEFFFLTNDSGGGICWHPGLYPGANGPEFCKNRSMNDRFGWLAKSRCRGGARFRL